MVIRVKFQSKSRVKHLVTLDLPRELVALILVLIFHSKSRWARDKILSRSKSLAPTMSRKFTVFSFVWNNSFSSVELNRSLRESFIIRARIKCIGLIRFPRRKIDHDFILLHIMITSSRNFLDISARFSEKILIEPIDNQSAE